MTTTDDEDSGYDREPPRTPYAPPDLREYLAEQDARAALKARTKPDGYELDYTGDL